MCEDIRMHRLRMHEIFGCHEHIHFPGGCCCGFDLTKEEKIALLEGYKKNLERELERVKNKIKKLEEK